MSEPTKIVYDLKRARKLHGRLSCRIFGCLVIQSYCGGPWCKVCGRDHFFEKGMFKGREKP